MKAKIVMYILILMPLFFPSCNQSAMPPDSKLTSKGFVYEIADDSITIIENQNNGPQIILPETIDGKPVTKIGQNAFYQQTQMVSVVLPQTLKTIEGAAFYRCYSLAVVILPESVETVEPEAFFRCSALTKIAVDPANKKYCDINGVLFNKEQTELIAYPEGNTMEQYTLPSTVTKIGDSAFGYRCPHLKELTIPASVVTFPTYNIFLYPDEITLKVTKNSVAEKYAQEHNLHYSIIA